MIVDNISFAVGQVKGKKKNDNKRYRNTYDHRYFQPVYTFVHSYVDLIYLILRCTVFNILEIMKKKKTVSYGVKARDSGIGQTAAGRILRGRTRILAIFVDLP